MWTTLQKQPGSLSRVLQGIYNIVDDRPSKLEEWLPGLCKLLGVKPPMKMPAWLGDSLWGERGVYDDPGPWRCQCESEEGARVKPAYPDWRTGFAAMFRSAS